MDNTLFNPAKFGVDDKAAFAYLINISISLDTSCTIKVRLRYLFNLVVFGYVFSDRGEVE